MLTNLLKPYQATIELVIKKFVDEFSDKNFLRDACEYALTGQGKRFRPALVLMIAHALNPRLNVSEAALSVELFHTASIIADDLPCMDDDDLRREKPSVHCVFGESTAILATYALISAGYACLVKNRNILSQSGFSQENADKICIAAIECVSENTGINGATSGQFLDLNPLKTLNVTFVRDVLKKKTVTLFEIAFVLGWLFGGGDFALLAIVKQSAAHFGMAFQIADDIEDQQADEKRHGSMNIANHLGLDGALKMFHEEILQFNQTLTLLDLAESDLATLSSVLAQKTLQNLSALK